VAIKLIHPHIASRPEFRRRFFAEAALGKRVQHPGLATVYDVVSEGAWLGTILEHVDGRELTAWIRPGGLPVAEAVALLTPLAAALDHLHSHSIVHRDLKPANVRVRPDGQPVLLDLGIAKDVSGASSGHTEAMTTMGTRAWMAPEQADAKSVTPAADVYALGLVTYTLLSGRLPWPESVTDHRILAYKLMGKLTPLSEVLPGVSAAGASAVMGALAVEPSRRPASCGALVAALSSPKNGEAEAAEMRRLREAAEALVAEATRVGARLRLPDKVTARWLEKAEQKVDEIKQARLRAAAEALVAEASSVGARLTLPDRVSARWLEKAQAKVSALVQQRRKAQARSLRSSSARTRRAPPDLDAYRHLLGKVPDAEVAAQAGTMAAIVGRHRRSLGIEAYAGPKTGQSPAGAVARPSPVLFYAEGTPDEQPYPVSDDGFSLGRGRDNDVQIKNDSKVSRFHCRILREDGSWFIEDNNTSNGTLVNGELVTKRRLWGGEEIITGDTFFRFRLL